MSTHERTRFARPIWDRGEPVDEELLRFTVGDDWLHDRRLVVHDIQGSLAHVAGLARAGLISEEDRAALERGLAELRAAHLSGEWTV